MAYWHARLGRWTPFAASALFAASRFLHSSPLRLLAYGSASVLVLLAAADFARTLLEPERLETDEGKFSSNIPVNWLQLLLTAALAGIYTYTIFAGLGPWVPLILLVAIYPLSCLVAWRNVRLWYRQGADYEEVLKEEEQVKEEEQIKRLRLPKSHWTHAG